MKGFTINTLNLVSKREKRLKIPIPPIQKPKIFGNWAIFFNKSHKNAVCR
jgi:hypothetical protein